MLVEILANKLHNQLLERKKRRIKIKIKKKKEEKSNVKTPAAPAEEPMPSEDVVNQKFIELLDSLDFAQKERDNMMKQNIQTKWMYIQNLKKKHKK